MSSSSVKIPPYSVNDGRTESKMKYKEKEREPILKNKQNLYLHYITLFCVTRFEKLKIF